MSKQEAQLTDSWNDFLKSTQFAPFILIANIKQFEFAGENLAAKFDNPDGLT